MIILTAIILAGKREEVIEKCLESLDWVDEKIVINAGANDKTLDIAKKYKSIIVNGNTEYDFAKWRNLGAKSAKGEWLLYVDTDERVTKELQEEILEVLKSQISNLKSEINGYYIPRKNFFWGKEFKTSWPDDQLRLLRKSSLLAWQGKIHETPKIFGSIGKLINPIIHLSHRSLESCIANTLEWSKLEALNRFNDNHPKMTGLRFIKIIIYGFIDQFVKKKVWKEGTEGVIEGIYQVFSLYFTYFRLWEMQKKEPLSSTYQNIDKQFK